MTNIDFSVIHSVDKNYENCKIDENGYIIRLSHSSYVGAPYKKDEESSLRYTYSQSFKQANCSVSISKIFEHGVFANDDFDMGEVIEESKIILLDTTTKTSKDWQLIRHAMILECDCSICNANGKTLFIGTGNLMIYNHSLVPNAVIKVDKTVKKASVIALRPILKNEEITIDYGKEYAAHHLKIKDVYPAANVPEGMPVKIIETIISTKPCKTCGEQSKNNEHQFRSMVVPERIL